MSDGPQDLALAGRALVIAGLEVHHALAHRSGLGPQDSAALLHLLADGPMAPGDLRRRLSLHASSMTELVERGVERGHLDRRSHPTDRRTYHVAITESGEHAAFAAFRPLIPVLHEAAARVPAGSHDAVLAYLEETAELLRAFARGAVDETPG